MLGAFVASGYDASSVVRADDETPPVLTTSPPAPDAAILAVVEVTGNDVNLRSGPSTDHHDVGSASRADLLLRVVRAASGGSASGAAGTRTSDSGAPGVAPSAGKSADGKSTDRDTVDGESGDGESGDGEFVRVRVPGGPVVYVFEALVEWEDGALRGIVRADDVLMRATPDQAYYPVHDQKLQRGDSLIVLGVETGEDGRWYRVIAPERIHVWIHGRYVRPTRLGPDSMQIVMTARARLDGLTDGRTGVERERVEMARRKRVTARLDALEEALKAGSATAEMATEAADVAAAERNEDIRRRAGDMQRSITKSVADRAAQAEREQIERMKTDAEEAQREQQRREEAHRRRMDEIGRRKQRADRGAPTVSGVVRSRGTRVWVETARAGVIDLRSLRFRLADYVGRTVRIWGKREKREGKSDSVEVTSIEIVGQ